VISFLINIGLLIGFSLFLMYNRYILSFISERLHVVDKIYYKLFGERLNDWNDRFEKYVEVNKEGLLYKIYLFFKDILFNLDMEKYRVTVFGLLQFIIMVGVSIGLFFVYWSGSMVLGVSAFGVTSFFMIVLFKFLSLMAYEKKEALIMDTEDLLAMDIKDGVYNAILRYNRSFHPDIKIYFDIFIDNVKNKGYSFKEAMLLLNRQLGNNFTDFAQKAILYEEKADDDMVDIFSSIVEVNRYKRLLRYESNKKFEQLRLQFIISLLVIVGYCVITYNMDGYIRHVFNDTVWGKGLLLGDIVLVTIILAYLASIKSKMF